MKNQIRASRLDLKCITTVLLLPILAGFAQQPPLLQIAVSTSLTGGTPVPITQPNSGVFVVGFEGFTNGRKLFGHEYAQVIGLRSRGSNAGLAVFDSTVGGPNDDGSDAALIVDTGNLLILQNDLSPGFALEGIYKNPTPDPNGGRVSIDFSSRMYPASIDLVALNQPAGYLTVSLVDSEERLRTYFVPGGFTGGFGAQSPPSFMRLDLSTLDPQMGANATATASEDAGFDANSVLEIQLTTNETVAFDRLEFRTGSFEDCDYPQRAYSAPSTSNPAVADLDNDGTLDMVTSTSEVFQSVLQDLVQVRLNPGDGKFDVPSLYPSGAKPVDIAIGDLTGNGSPDIIVANKELPIFTPTDGGISILANRGDGSFDPRIEQSLPGQMQTVVLRDFDGDGDLDVCVGNQSTFFFPALNPTRVLTLINGGTGQFTKLFTSIINTGSAGPIASADLDGDGLPEVVRSNESEQSLKLLFNKGNGDFNPAVNFAALGGIGAYDIADVDLDGDNEILFASSAIWVYNNNGGGVFSFPLPNGELRSVESMGATDWDSDGYVDVVVGKNAGMALFRNNKQGGFVQSRRYELPHEPSGLAFADIDDDSDIDFIVLADTGNDQVVQTWFNRGDGRFKTRIEYPGFQATEDLLIEDLNGDANLDVVAADSAGDQIAVYAGNGTGALEPPTIYPVEQSPVALISADLNGDGAVDLAAACSHGDAVSVLLNQGDGTYAQQVAYSTTFSSTQDIDTPEDMTAGDWNNDGFIDLAVGNDFGSSVQQHLLTMTNNGDGTFADAVRLDLLSFITSVTNADFDQDGDQDLAVVVGIKGFSPSKRRVSIQLGDGMGNFTTADEVIASRDVDKLRVADWNGDGLLDLVASQRVVLSMGPTFGVILNQGGADFELGDEFIIEEASAFEIADLDSDGNHEILVTSFTTRNLLSIHEQQIGPVLSTPNRFATGGTISAIATGDLNNDGRPDLVSAGFGFSDLVILLMECD
ncbi:MAG: hypothetical protein ACI8TQ_002770 [Planctomycetota bacterium]|jgi:hypothetical protein